MCCHPRFVSDLVGNLEEKFSCEVAHNGNGSFACYDMCYGISRLLHIYYTAHSSINRYSHSGKIIINELTDIYNRYL